MPPITLQTLHLVKGYGKLQIFLTLMEQFHLILFMDLFVCFLQDA